MNENIGNIAEVYDVIITPDTYDSIDVYMRGHTAGFGFIPKERNAELKVALMRCPMCGKENYHAHVLKGSCAWCPYTTHGLRLPNREKILNAVNSFDPRKIKGE